MADIETVDKLKSLLGVKEEEKTIHLEFALDNAEEAVKNYCHIDTIPEGLSMTLLRMAMDIYRNERLGEAEVPQAVKSISMGDTSTSFGVTETTGYAESLLRDYKKQLNPYRRVVF